MNIKTYNDARVTLLESPSEPGVLSKTAVKLTQTKLIEKWGSLGFKTLDFVTEADHNITEHEVFTFALENVSRSFLAQITRHRAGKFTSASQHYADYRDMPLIVAPDTPTVIIECFKRAFETALSEYKLMIELGYPPEEARQALPNACATNIIWTVDARNLGKFLTQRLCKRNVLEMQLVARKINLCVGEVWPDLYMVQGPNCHTGRCLERGMTCGSIWTPDFKPTLKNLGKIK